MYTDLAKNIGTAKLKLLSPKQFYEYFSGKVGRTAIYDAVRNNRIRHIKLGKQKILILASEVEDWPTREAETK